MDEIKKKCKKVGLQQSLIFTTYGLGCAILLFILLIILVGEIQGLISFLLRILNSIIVAVAALYITAAILGSVAGDLICKFKEQDIRIKMVGIALAESCLLISALVGSSVEFFANLKDAFPFSSYIGKPTFSVMLFGFIPALVLGIIYSSRVKRFIKEDNHF